MKDFIKASVFVIGQFALVTVIAMSLSDCGAGSHDDHGDGGDGGTVASTGGGGTASGGNGGATPAPAAVDTSKPGTATIKGAVKFKGAAPKRLPLPMAADPACLKANEGQPVLDETVVVGEDGSLENVFVYVSNISGSFDAPSTPAVIDQNGCVYRPHIVGMIAGQELEIRNSDATNHNINALPKINKKFNINMGPSASPNTRKDFRRPEMSVLVKCNVHPWMNARLHVMSHPFFALAASGGTFEIPEKLPAGTYTVVALHETLGEQKQEVTVADGETKEVTFEFGQ